MIGLKVSLNTTIFRLLPHVCMWGGQVCLCAAVRAAGVIREYQRVEGASAVPPDFRFVGGLDLQPENGRRAAQPAAGRRADGL